MSSLNDIKRCRGFGRPAHLAPTSDFAASKSTGDGLQKLCRGCHSESMKAYRSRLKERSAARDTALVDALFGDVEHMKVCRRCISSGRPGQRPVGDFYGAMDQPDGKRSHCKDCVRELRWISYGIQDMTVERYAQMLSEQGGKCAIPSCQSLDGEGRRLDVDHDHATGEVRGLLCKACNTVLGKSRESVSVLVEMISYLQSHRGLPSVGT